jgi:hypothetical protein
MSSLTIRATGAKQPDEELRQNGYRSLRGGTLLPDRGRSSAWLDAGIIPASRVDLVRGSVQ